MKYTMQSAFDTMVRHLAQMKERCAEFSERAGYDVCRYYRGDGVRCVVGALMPEEMAKRAEEENWGDPGECMLHSEFRALFDAAVPDDLMDGFLSEVQNAHDRAGSWGAKGFESWRLLVSAAREYKLNTKVLDEVRR